MLFNPLQSSSISSILLSLLQSVSIYFNCFNPFSIPWSLTHAILCMLCHSPSRICAVFVLCCDVVPPPLLSYFPSPSPSLSHCFCRVVLLPATLSNIIRYERYVWWMSKQARDRERRATYFIIRCNFWVFSVGVISGSFLLVSISISMVTIGGCRARVR